jgi:hypothetical protein
VAEKGKPKKVNRPQLDDVTRIDIVTELGRYTFWGDSWHYDEQDEGRTLKLFAKGDGAQARAERDAALHHHLVQDHEYVQRMMEAKK